MINTRFLYYKTQESFEADKPNILNDSIVFVGDPPIIWTHGTYYTGGSGPGPTPTPTYSIDISATPILYLLSAERDVENPQFTNTIRSLSAGSATTRVGTSSLNVSGKYLYMAVPNNITFISAKTSPMGETLYPAEDFVVDTETLEGHTIYKLLPAVLSSNMSITFTFRVR